MAGALGRPRGFDIDEAISQARAVFWQHGVEATSLATLAATIGVHKPSLYAAYGSKRDLYVAALDAYQRDAGKLVSVALGRKTLRDALLAFFAADIDLFMGEGGRGCFMLATAVPLAPNDDEVGERVRRSLDALRDAIATRIEQAAQAGDFPAAIDQPTAADLIVSTHIAIASRARSGEERAALRRIVTRIVDLLCPRPH